MTNNISDHLQLVIVLDCAAFTLFRNVRTELVRADRNGYFLL